MKFLENLDAEVKAILWLENTNTLRPFFVTEGEEDENYRFPQTGVYALNGKSARIFLGATESEAKEFLIQHGQSMELGWMYGIQKTDPGHENLKMTDWNGWGQ